MVTWGEGILRNGMFRAIISVIVKTALQTGVWFCFRQHFGFIFSSPTETFACVLLQNIEFNLN